MNKYPIGLQLCPGDIVRFDGILKEVETGNTFEPMLGKSGIWTSVQFVGDLSFYFTHKGGIEPIKVKHELSNHQ